MRLRSRQESKQVPDVVSQHESWTLVTGGAGCIGSDLVDALLQRGNSIVVLDNLSSGKLEHLSEFHDNPRFRFIEGDLFDLAAVDAARSEERRVGEWCG